MVSRPDCGAVPGREQGGGQARGGAGGIGRRKPYVGLAHFVEAYLDRSSQSWGWSCAKCEKLEREEETPPPCVVVSPDACPLIKFANFGRLAPDDARAWTVWIRYETLIEKGMWAMVEKTLPEMDADEMGALASNLATIMNVAEAWRARRRREAVESRG